MKQRWEMILLVACLLLALTGCGEKEPPEQIVETPPVEEPVPMPEPAPEPKVPTGRNPLTGEPVEVEEEALRPVAVMFNNLKAAQPQLGISQADVIYEVTAEGGITRMLGVFQNLEDVGTLGSIRSARPYYIELALGHDAVFVHAGGSPQAYQDLRNWGVDHMDGVNGQRDAEIFWRDKKRRKTMHAEHTMVTSGEKILEYLQSVRFPVTHQEGWSTAQTYQEDGTPSAGTPAERITLKFSPYKTGVFEYDAQQGVYLASQYGKAYRDGASGDQVAATNLLILETRITLVPGDTEGRLNVRLSGGKGTYCCGGKAIPIQWSKAGRNSPIAYTLMDGTPLVLGQGKSYVCIMSPSSSTLTISPAEEVA